MFIGADGPLIGESSVAGRNYRLI